MAAQLHIVSTHTPAAKLAEQAATPAERVFAHWTFMLGKNPKRTALGPVRRRVIERALALYDEETLLLAIEGGAASRWHAGENDRGRAFDDIELWLRDEAHIERFATDGEALRERAARDALREQREAAQARSAPAGQPASDPAAVALAKERLRDLAARMRRGR